MADSLPPEIVSQILRHVVDPEVDNLTAIPYSSDPFHEVEEWRGWTEQRTACLITCALIHRSWTPVALEMLLKFVVVPDLHALQLKRLKSSCKNATDVFLAVLSPSFGLWTELAESGLNKLKGLQTLHISPGANMRFAERHIPLTPTQFRLRHLSVRCHFPYSVDWLANSLDTLEHLEVQFDDDAFDEDMSRAVMLTRYWTELLQYCVPTLRRLTFKDLRISATRRELPPSDERSQELPLIDILASATKLERLRLAIDRCLGYESKDYCRFLEAVGPTVRLLELGEFFPLPQVREVLRGKTDRGDPRYLRGVQKIVVVDASTTRWTANRTTVDDEQKALRAVCDARGISVDIVTVF
ncbi:hypothetical protein OIO90_003877 [Microbotryomycetes sp. JL221]|nr:hypothetical protein OIO90_003877 [Microbotryomycetes sp. JL221]